MWAAPHGEPCNGPRHFILSRAPKLRFEPLYSYTTAMMIHPLHCKSPNTDMCHIAQVNLEDKYVQASRITAFS